MGRVQTAGEAPSCPFPPSRPPLLAVSSRERRLGTRQVRGASYVVENVFTFGGAKRSGSDRECKYFPIGMNAREPLWR